MPPAGGLGAWLDEDADDWADSRPPAAVSDAEDEADVGGLGASGLLIHMQVGGAAGLARRHGGWGVGVGVHPCADEVGT
jgi:hypothetical protein